MVDRVSSAYDELAERYTSLFLGELEDDADAQVWLARFVDLAAPHERPVLDVGCGPGSGVDALVRAGLNASGIDASPGMIEQARRAFPQHDFALGDLTRIDEAPASLGGILSRYSIIHLPPAGLERVFAEWFRVLAPGASVLLFFFASRNPDAHGAPFDHKVTTAYELDLHTIADTLARVGFVEVEAGASPTPAGGRPLDKGAVLCRRPVVEG